MLAWIEPNRGNRDFRPLDAHYNSSRDAEVPRNALANEDARNELVLFFPPRSLRAIYWTVFQAVGCRQAEECSPFRSIIHNADALKWFVPHRWCVSAEKIYRGDRDFRPLDAPYVYIYAELGLAMIPFTAFNIACLPGDPLQKIQPQTFYAAHGRWSLRELAIPDDYFAAVAVEEVLATLQVRHWTS